MIGGSIQVKLREIQVIPEVGIQITDDYVIVITEKETEM